MKNKKTLIILASVVAVCLLGVILSLVIDWPVDTSKASGNIAKTSRFSRKTADEGASNMQELLLNDENYKDGILLAYLVMKARTDQFGTLVKMSNEAAGGIKDFEPVLKDMQKAQTTIDNVCASLRSAGEDINTALGGETAPDLAQNTNNAALAYNTLQKLNSLADRFIETTDNYLKKSDADDRLKLVRDQWVNYQQVSATLDSDEERVKEFELKGNLLNSEESVDAIKSFNMDLTGFFEGVDIAHFFGMEDVIYDSPDLQVVRNLAMDDVVVSQNFDQGVVHAVGDIDDNLNFFEDLTLVSHSEGLDNITLHAEEYVDKLRQTLEVNSAFDLVRMTQEVGGAINQLATGDVVVSSFTDMTN